MFQDRLPYLGFGKISAPRSHKIFFPGHFPQCLRSLAAAPEREAAILLFPPATTRKLLALPAPSRADYFSRMAGRRPALLVFAQSATLPVLLKKQMQGHRLPAVASPLHENLLASRIRSILREKIHRCVTLHGVVLSCEGRGILLTGPSGIGKTTAALEAARKGYGWIADDVAVIKKNAQGRLMISGHPGIQKYIHTKATGIAAGERILPGSRMRKKAELAFIIDVFRTAREEISRPVETRILEQSLPLVRVGVPRTGYLRQNLIERAIQKLSEVG